MVLPTSSLTKTFPLMEKIYEIIQFAPENIVILSNNIPHLPSIVTKNEDMISSFRLILTQGASTGHYMSSLHEIIMSEDFVLKSQPIKNVDLWSESREPGLRPGRLLF